MIVAQVDAVGDNNGAAQGRDGAGLIVAQVLAVEEIEEAVVVAKFSAQPEFPLV